ncbi:MAG: hypothetical protein HY901_29980, partial [Deltaproteobacteria bacterium]|nr:hypothetical protein [Deltaproteobacteria bacterium]
LFGLLAVELAMERLGLGLRMGGAVLFFLIAVFFVWRSFYGMRIGSVVAVEVPRQAKQDAA